MRGAFTVPEEFSVTVKGAVISGEARGEGPPLVFVHGMAGDRREWDGLIAALPAAFPLLRYDLRGFGRSEAADGIEYSHTDDLLAVLDAQGIERTAVVGLSLGGGIALNFALSYPERVSRVILISPAIVGWEWSDEWRALWRHVVEAARAGDLALARERWFQHPMFAALREDPAAAEDLSRSIAGYHGRQWVRDRQRDELPDLDRLHGLAMPALLLTGERDMPDFRLIADMIDGVAPNVRRFDYPAGHMLHVERRDDVARAILDFLA